MGELLSARADVDSSNARDRARATELNRRRICRSKRTAAVLSQWYDHEQNQPPCNSSHQTNPRPRVQLRPDALLQLGEQSLQLLATLELTPAQTVLHPD